MIAPGVVQGVVAPAEVTQVSGVVATLTLT